MSLDEEIGIIQFGQGVRSAADLLNHVRQREVDKEDEPIFYLYCLIRQLKPTAPDLEQALIDSGLDAAYTPCLTARSHRILTFNMGQFNSERENDYTFLLYVFKVVYQRQYALEKENATDWWYWNLSNPELVQTIHTTHQALVEEVYNNPSFRGEFSSLAKLRQAEQALYRANDTEPAVVSTKPANFITYDDMLTAYVTTYGGLNKYSRSKSLLYDTLANAFKKRYGLDAGKAGRLIWDVVGRHLGIVS